MYNCLLNLIWEDGLNWYVLWMFCKWWVWIEVMFGSFLDNFLVGWRCVFCWFEFLLFVFRWCWWMSFLLCLMICFVNSLMMNLMFCGVFNIGWWFLLYIMLWKWYFWVVVCLLWVVILVVLNGRLRFFLMISGFINFVVWWYLCEFVVRFCWYCEKLVDEIVS